LVQKRDTERWYTYYANESVTYLDYTYCVNETRLPVLRSLYSKRTLFRVSFYTETLVVAIEGEYLYKYFLTDRPWDCFKFSFNLSRGTFPIDYLVFHKLEIPARAYKKRAYTKNDPRYFEKRPTYNEWNEKNQWSPTFCTVIYQEQVLLRGEPNEEYNEDLIAHYANDNYLYT
jgi:hypothetical protein